MQTTRFTKNALGARSQGQSMAYPMIPLPIDNARYGHPEGRFGKVRRFCRQDVGKVRKHGT